jgi:molybdate transport system permease protein
VLQAGPVDTVFQRPATLRVAELLGLHNIGTGVVRAAGEIETAGGLILASADSTLEAGTRVMWRVSPRALRMAADGTYVGTIGGGSLRHGDRYLTVQTGGESFDVAGEDLPSAAGGMLRFAIDPGGVSVWLASTVETRVPEKAHL